MDKKQVAWSSTAKKQFYSVLEKMAPDKKDRKEMELFASDFFKKVKSGLKKGSDEYLGTSEKNVHAIVLPDYMILFEAVTANIVILHISINRGI